MNDILNNLIETCEWRNDTMGVPVCSAELGACAKIIESGKCPVLIYRIKHLKKREKLIKDLQENQGHYGYNQKGDRE